jgi:hypothetical protein
MHEVILELLLFQIWLIAKAPPPFRASGACFSLEILFMIAVDGSPGSDLNFENHTEITKKPFKSLKSLKSLKCSSLSFLLIGSLEGYECEELQFS